MQSVRSVLAVFMIPMFVCTVGFASQFIMGAVGRTQPYPNGTTLQINVLMETGTTTHCGTTYPVWALAGSDFTGTEQAYIANQMYSVGLGGNSLQSPASAVFNCYTYAIGGAGGWLLEDISEHIRDEHCVLETDLDEATMAFHSATANHNDLDHASRVTTDTVYGVTIHTYTGKYGAAGIYETSLTKPEDVYNADYTKNYKEE